MVLGRVLDVGPQRGDVVGLDLVVVRADVEAAGLAAGDGLGDAEEGGAQDGDALGLQGLGGVEGRPGAGDLDAEAVAADAVGAELAIVQAGVGQGDDRVVGLGRQRLQQHAAADEVNVLFAHQHGHARVDGQPALVVQRGRRRAQQRRVALVAQLNVHPQLVARLIVEGDGGLHRPDVVGVHPVDVDVDCWSAGEDGGMDGRQTGELYRVWALTLLLELVEPCNRGHVYAWLCG